MEQQLKEMKIQYDELSKNYGELSKNYEEALIKIENLTLIIQQFQKMLYGSKSEKTSKLEPISENQCSLFTEEKEEKVAENDLQKQSEEEVKKLIVYERSLKKRERKAGLRSDKLSGIEIIEEYEDIDKDAVCPVCGGELKDISKKIVRTEIDFEPAKLKIKHYVQITKKCKVCGTGKNENTNSVFVKSHVPTALIPHSFVSPSLAAEVICQKYNLSVPLYRQEKMWYYRGLILPRYVMANWVIKISEYYLEQLVELMATRLKKNCDLLHLDESTIQVNKEPGREANSKSYMWLMTSGVLEQTQGSVFKYNSSRSAETAKKFIDGFKGIAVTDRLCSL